jgi:cell division transport system ATP-binding protein
LVNDPDIIIWDEPTWNLDPITAMEIMNIFSDLNKTYWKTVILATHDKHIVDSMSRRVIAFNEKWIISDTKNGIYNL